LRSAAQMRREAFDRPFELSGVKEAQTGRKKREHRRGFVLSGRKGGGRPRLVVIFQKAGQLVLVIQARVKMLAHRPGMSFAQPIVEPLVVGVIESLLL